MNSNVSRLLTQSPTNYLINWNKITLNPDPMYFPEIKTHLNNNPEYRAERRAWTKIKKSDLIKWGLFWIQDEFCRYYLEPFYRDVELFLNSCTQEDPREQAESLCKEWRGYYNVYGVEFVERVINQVRWRNKT
jgi:hypothetical protein